MGKTSMTKKKKTPIIRIIFLYVTQKVGLDYLIGFLITMLNMIQILVEMLDDT